MKAILIVLLITIITSCGCPFEPFVEPRENDSMEIFTDTTTNDYTITIEV